MATPATPYQLYVVSADSKKQTLITMADLIASGPNALSIGTDNKFFVAPSTLDIVSLTSEANVVTLEYVDKNGVTQELTANMVNTNMLQFNDTTRELTATVNGVGATVTLPAWTKTEITDLGVDGNTIALIYKDAAGTTQTKTTTTVQSVGVTYDPVTHALVTTVNGVASNSVDLSTLSVDIQVQDVEWDPATFTLTLTKTDNTEITVDLSSLVPVTVQDSITGNGTAATPLKLVGDVAAPGNSKVYGTDSVGAKGWQTLVSADGGNQAKIGTDHGVFVGKVIGDTQVVNAANSTDVPLDYVGNPDVNLYGPSQFRIALDQKTGLPLTGPNGRTMVVALWELPTPQV